MEESKAHKLARIIIQIRLKNVDHEERAYLNDWLDESVENRMMYKRIVRGECIARRLRVEEEIRKTASYKEVERRVVHMLKDGRHRKWLRLTYWGGGVAACIAIVLFCLSVVRLHTEKSAGIPSAQVLVAAMPEADYEAVLVLGDGSKVNLYGEKPEIRQENITVVGEEGRLVYQEEREEPEDKESEAFNKVITGKKGYMLTLSDGTHVWLNGNSELEYPVRFGGETRVVGLRGEAYFEVAKDTAHPFIVKTENLYTKVLGTSFNIKAYPEESKVSTTLLVGKVEVSLPEEPGKAPVHTVLSPGMQAQVFHNNPEIVVKEVVAEDAIAWRQGEFIFTDEDMLTVLHTLSRWFGVDFIQEKAGKSYTFSGMVSRDDQLFAVLEMLTMAGGPRFVIHGNKVYIKEK